MERILAMLLSRPTSINLYTIWNPRFIPLELSLWSAIIDSGQAAIAYDSEVLFRGNLSNLKLSGTAFHQQFAARIAPNGMAHTGQVSVVLFAAFSSFWTWRTNAFFCIHLILTEDRMTLLLVLVEEDPCLTYSKGWTVMELCIRAM